MKRWFVTVLVFGMCSAAVRADVTVVQTTTIEGGMAAMAGGGGAPPSPKVTVRVKGMKSRTDMDMQPTLNISSITDLVAKQMIMLRHDQKTAQTVDAAAPAAPAARARERDGETRRDRHAYR